MPISLTCPTCDKTFRSADANAGKRGKCPGCGTPIQIPAAEAGAERVASDEEPAQAVAAPTAAQQSGLEGLPNLDDAPVEEPEATFSLPAFGLGALAAVCGAALWAFVLIKLEREIGWVAWGLGWLIGTAVVKAGGRGIQMAALAALLALVSIGGGKWGGMAIVVAQQFGSSFEQEIEQVVSRGRNAAAYAEAGEDARLWVALEEPPSDATVAQFMLDRDYAQGETIEEVTAEDLEWFRLLDAPALTEFDAEPPTYDVWAEERAANIRANMLGYASEITALGVVMDNLEGVDLVFVALGIATAWGLVMKAPPARRRRRRPVRDAA